MDVKITVELSPREAEILCRYLIAVVPSKADELILAMLYARIKQKYEEST